MAERILILGEAPGGRLAGGLTRRRISELSGRPWEEWAEWRNLLDEWPGHLGKGSAWNVLAARAAARELDVSGYDRVILLGRRVAGATLPAGAGLPFFRWLEWGGVPAAVIPHTSGIVRWWNQPANVATAAAFLRALAQPVNRKERGRKMEVQELHSKLLERVRETAGAGATEIEKKGYVRLTVEGSTLAYVCKPSRTGVRVEIPADDGGYDKIKVTAAGEIRKAVAAVEKRAKKITAASTPAEQAPEAVTA